MLWVQKFRVPFTMLLPVLSLAVWAVVIAIPAAANYMELEKVTRGVLNATVTVGTFHTTIPPEKFLAFAVNKAVVTHSHAITAMDLPGALVEMPLALATTRPEEWYPKRLEEWTWRALATPFYCLPAWWLVGIGVESLLGRRRVRWPWGVLGSALCGLLIVVLCGFLFGGATSDRAGGGWVYAGLGMWIGLFALLPVSGVLRGRRDQGRR